MTRALWLILILPLVASGANAHDWYPPKCCSGRDCAQVAPDAIVCDPEGCTITIVPGTHPMVREGMNGGQPVVLRTTKKPEMSPDGQNHACVGGALQVLCVFVGGVF